MRIKQLAAAFALVFALVAAVIVLGDAFGNTPATADTAAQSPAGDGAAEVAQAGDVTNPDGDGDHEYVGQDDNDEGELDDDEEDEGDEEEGAHLAGEAVLSVEEAIAIAGAEVTGKAGEVELEREDGALIYEISFDSGYEVEVDATTGEIIEIEQDDD